MASNNLASSFVSSCGGQGIYCPVLCGGKCSSSGMLDDYCEY